MVLGTPFVRVVSHIALAFALGALAACDHHCGLGERDRVTVSPAQAGTVPCCGGAAFVDIPLNGQTSDPEFSLSNVAMPTQPGGVDAYLVPTSCQKLFDGPYPDATPLCTILLGPAKPGGVSNRAKLTPGTYRVYLQGYANVAAPVGYLVDVYIWDYSCRPLIG
jgi:hypothetical protein